MEKEICQGFQFAGVIAGLYPKKRKDMGIIFAKNLSDTAGLFTKNTIKAAPVLLDIERVKSGKSIAIIANSGNANCCIGRQGMLDAIESSKYAAQKLNIDENHVLLASTGVIGKNMEMDKIKTGIDALIDSMSENNLSDFAQSIMTTDTVPKIVTQKGEIEGKTFTITAIAKGSGMIKPDMATMLCFVLTDIEAEDNSLLHKCLEQAAKGTLNSLTIDGDTSTNDTVLIMANRMSGVKLDNKKADQFTKVLESVLMQIAEMLVKDGEGVTKLVEVNVTGALNYDQARKAAYRIAESSLVKTAFFGQDANWGRIFMALGKTGADIDPEKIDLFFDDVKIADNGAFAGIDAEKKASEVMKKDRFKVTVDLKIGGGSASVLTCDFSVDYVKINADYRS